jgi:Fe-S cluster assembly iron-binding protein IscA
VIFVLHFLEEKLIRVTERAKAELKAILVSNVDNTQACLRLRYNQQEQLGLGIDIELPGDRLVEYEGSKLLVVEQELADSLKNVYIDVEDTDEGKQLVIVEKSAQKSGSGWI